MKVYQVNHREWDYFSGDSSEATMIICSTLENARQYCIENAPTELHDTHTGKAWYEIMEYTLNEENLLDAIEFWGVSGQLPFRP